MDTKNNNEIEIIVNRFKVNDFDYTINKSAVLLKKFPNNDLLWNIRGLSFQSKGNIRDSIECFKMALNKNPKNIAARNNLGNSFKYANELKLAQECFEVCINKDPDYLASLVNLANLKTIVNDFNSAIDLYEKVLKKDENIESVYVNLAQAYQSTNKFEKSNQIIQEGLRKYPHQTKIDKLLSAQINYNKDDTHLNQMLDKLQNSKFNDDQKINLYFAIGKAYEDKKKYSKSYEFYLKGNSLKREKIKFNIKDKIKLFEDIKKYFDKNLKINSNENNNSKKAIFIFGLPRSGTTLVENIISSHKKVSGVGEINYLNKFFNLNFVRNNQLNLQFIEEFLDKDLQKFYFEFIKNFNISTEIITDKSLNIYWFLGFIKNFFPNSIFIHCERDPKDNCLSIFKNLFEDGEGWKYNETELIEYYKLYSEIMKFWNSKYKDGVLNVKYEELVNNSEKEIKKIINYCKLDWDENCLNHHKNNQPIKTLSLNQANKPIYSTSVKSSDNFKHYLKEIFSAF